MVDCSRLERMSHGPEPAAARRTGKWWREVSVGQLVGQRNVKKHVEEIVD